jgi:hypothetical protein
VASATIRCDRRLTIPTWYDPSYWYEGVKMIFTITSPRA